MSNPWPCLAGGGGGAWYCGDQAGPACPGGCGGTGPWGGTCPGGCAPACPCGAAPNAAPHDLQNRSDASFWNPHCGHCIWLSYRRSLHYMRERASHQEPLSNALVRLPSTRRRDLVPSALHLLPAIADTPYEV
ncbi:MAG: hypothetical protein Kow0056_11540 [Coriobacteriia bacterium]